MEGPRGRGVSLGVKERYRESLAVTLAAILQ